MQQWDAEQYGRDAAFVSALGEGVVELLSPRAGERILDLGCGDGTLTARIAESGAAVEGVDAAESMVAAARARGIEARVLDAARLDGREEFDAVFTNAVLHWILDIAPVARAVFGALRPGGRFVGEFGGHGNVAAIRTAVAAVVPDAPVIWYYPTAGEFSAVLQDAGFTEIEARLFPRPTPLPAGMANWLETFAQPLFAGVPEAERFARKEQALALLRPILCDRDGRWHADYVRLRFRAYKPGR